MPAGGRCVVVVVVAACGRIGFDGIATAPDAAVDAEIELDGCVDLFDRNDTWPGAAIAQTTPCESLDHALDAAGTAAVSDWYAAPYLDAGACDHTPNTKVTAGIEVELCVYFACANGATAAITCNTGDTAARNGDAAGCCRRTVDPQVRLLSPNCNAPGPIVSGENHGTLDIQVQLVGGAVDGCTPYALAWGDS